ncbi:hypothetical protein FRC03_012290 [Tulasnella sp. 419]|nr:hypothetical protein FRC02_007299 [Tulasnella sp. 418]KAG8952058.1 hypothetical protein FRC03_012290 [Tulasnella sp. 419]
MRSLMVPGSFVFYATDPGIQMTDRWQSFMFGRPIGISNHHFDTKYPMEDNSDLAASATSNPELAYLQNFRLVAVMGDIQDDALCLRPVPYERIEAHDQSIQHLIETLPPDFNQDEIVFARNAYRGLEFKRHAVQSIMCRAALHHVRLTLHRPYTAPRASGDFFLRASEENRMKSFETAVVAADKVIQLVARTGQEYVGHPTLNVPGHLSWGPFHAFGAAMFFTFQLIWRPGQLGAGQFKANIARVLSALELVRANNPYSQKAWSVLSALRPLWDDEGGLMLDDKQKNEIWDNARRLAFPIHTGSSVSDNESRSSPGSGSSPGSDAYMRRASSGTGNSPVEGVTNGTTRNGLNHAWTSSPANSMHSAPTPSVSAVGGSGTGGSLFPVNTGGVLMANNGGTPASVYGSGTVSANITGGTSASGIHPRIEGVNNSSTGTITPPGYSNPSFTSQSTHVQHAIPQHYPSHQHQRSHSQPYIDAFPPGPTEDALWSASLGLYQPGDWSNMIGNVMRPADHRGNNGRGFLG